MSIYRIIAFLGACWCAAVICMGCAKGSDRPNPITPNDSILRPKMIRIPAGTFTMGDTLATNESPVHSVVLPTFLMSETDITQEQYASVMGFNPSFFYSDTSDSQPVESITWYDAALYCNALSKASGKCTTYLYTDIIGAPGDGCVLLTNLAASITVSGYRLPSEAEWEYAARAGDTTDYFWGGGYPLSLHLDTVHMDDHAIWAHNSLLTTWPVAARKPNAWGLYDMVGNVWQWCNDWYGSYPDSQQIDPKGTPDHSGTKVRRGGCYSDSTGFFLRSAARSASAPRNYNESTGFRVVCRP